MGSTTLESIRTIMPDPDPDRDTSVSLADFGYVQSVYNELRKTNTVARSQTMLITQLKDSSNKSAIKFLLYYNELIGSGKPQMESMSVLSKRFSLNLVE